MLKDDRCTACGGNLTSWLRMPIDAKKNEAMPYSTVLQCAACRLGVLDPLPAADAIPAFYVLDHYYTHGSGHIIPREPNLAERVLTKLAWIMDRERPFDPSQIATRLSADARICDIGCGDAAYLRKFRELGFDVIGVDPDPVAQDRAKQAGIRVEPGTGEDLPSSMPAGGFDLVIMTHSLEHCRNPRQALQNAVTLMKPGGFCYVEVPNCASNHFLTFTICSEMFDAPRHIHFFSPDNLKAMMVDLGLTPVDMLYHGFVRNYLPSWRDWEATIANRLLDHDPKADPRRHSFAQSTALFLRTFWQKPEKKYDSFGWLMRRPVC